MSFQNLLLVGVGGFFGSMVRFYAVQAVGASIQRTIPYGTLFVNIAGSFILGAIYAFAWKKSGISESVKLLFGAGFCGGFTTFSAFAWENLQLITQKNLIEALGYILASLIFGIIATLAGFSLVKAF